MTPFGPITLYRFRRGSSNASLSSIPSVMYFSFVCADDLSSNLMLYPICRGNHKVITIEKPKSDIIAQEAVSTAGSRKTGQRITPDSSLGRRAYQKSGRVANGGIVMRISCTFIFSFLLTFRRVFMTITAYRPVFQWAPHALLQLA